MEEIKEALKFICSYQGPLEDFLLYLQSPGFIDSFGISQIFFCINNVFEFKKYNK